MLEKACNKCSVVVNYNTIVQCDKAYSAARQGSRFRRRPSSLPARGPKPSSLRRMEDEIPRSDVVRAHKVPGVAADSAVVTHAGVVLRGGGAVGHAQNVQPTRTD